MRSAAFRSLVRAAARDVHRSVFDRDASTVTLAIADVGVLLNEAIRHLRPDLAGRLPSGLDVTLSGATAQATVDALEVAERVRRLAVVLAGGRAPAGARRRARGRDDPRRRRARRLVRWRWWRGSPRCWRPSRRRC